MVMKNLIALALTGMLLVGGCGKGKDSSNKNDGGKPSDQAKGNGTKTGGDSSAVKSIDPKSEAKAAEAGAAFDKVNTGMSVDEVTAIMGPPKAQFSTGEIAQYHWEKGPANFVVQFKDGKVFHKVYAADRSGSSAGTGKKKDFARIKVGMTPDEVVKILGRPTQESSGMDGAFNGGTQHWEDGKASLTVVYQNGKVMAVSVDSGDGE